MLPLPGVAQTLVVADTGGVHYRGRAEPGVLRRAWRLAGDNDGGLARLHPFRPVGA
jgi:hypothetical protein